jgi:hypothetical protein
MSDENKPRDMTAVREHAERLRREADAAWAAQALAETSAIQEAIAARATAALAAFRDLPCRGEVIRIGDCGETQAATCDRRETPSCPRNIVALDLSRVADELRERLIDSGVPKGVRKVLATEFQPTPCTMAVDEWLASGKSLLLLAGGFGTGKTVAGGYAIKRRPGRWMHASEIKRAARFEHEARMLELQHARLLVVDDVGSEFNDASGWGRATLTELLLVRYDNELPTIMTTNLGPAAWKTYADPRIADRLGGKLGQVFGASGESMRRV